MCVWGPLIQSRGKEYNTLCAFNLHTQQPPQCDWENLSLGINLWLFPTGWLTSLPLDDDCSSSLEEPCASGTVSFAQPVPTCACYMPAQSLCSLHFLVLMSVRSAWAWASLCPWRVSPASLWKDAEISYILMSLSPWPGCSLMTTTRFFKILLWSWVPGTL